MISKKKTPPEYGESPYKRQRGGEKRKGGLDPGAMGQIVRRGAVRKQGKHTGPIMVADQTNIFASLAGPALQDTGGSRLMSLNSYEWEEDMGVSEGRQRARIT